MLAVKLVFCFTVGIESTKDVSVTYSQTFYLLEQKAPWVLAVGDMGETQRRFPHR